jgi:hypothetical protein
MIEALKDSLPMALGLALSPFPVIAIIIILMTPKAKINALAFLLGWIAGIYLVGLLIFLMPGLETKQGNPTTFSGIIKVLAGLSLLIFAFRSWLKRPKAGDEIKTPKLFLTLDKFSIWQSLLTGFLFSAANVKNMAFSATGAARIDYSLVNDNSIYTALLIFAIMGSLTLVFPIGIYLLIGDKIEPTFIQWKTWLIKNNAILLIILLGSIGLMLLKSGVEIFI